MLTAESAALKMKAFAVSRHAMLIRLVNQRLRQRRVASWS